MPKYRVTEYAVVRIVSEEITADEPIEAYSKYATSVELPQLLRNVVGTAIVHSVEFADYKESALISLFDEKGEFQEVSLELSDEEINSPEDLANWE